jgi:F-type H+-transporting ATPase subunit b
VRLPELKARLIEQGERRKEELIQDARAQSLLVMEGARHKIEYQILRAREKLVVELLDMAIEEALKEMPHVITAEDDRRRVEKFLAIAEAR